MVNRAVVYSSLRRPYRPPSVNLIYHMDDTNTPKRREQNTFSRGVGIFEFSHKFSIDLSGETKDRIKKSSGDAKTGRTSTITLPSMVGIVGRAPAVD